MNWDTFHHPDVSLPVIRRRTRDELIILLSETAAFFLSRGASDLYGHCYPNQRAYHSSVARLKKSGLVAHLHRDGSLPSLRLTDDGKAAIPDYYRPREFWETRWNKRWYVLMFDVPERERAYRDHLRSFLKQRHFGCLQKSVWVTPRDVRPEYDDLERAAAVDSVAFLFEAQTVLGHGAQSVVRHAWNFDQLEALQGEYIRFVDRNLEKLGSHAGGEAELVQLLRMDNLAYSQAMALDPLLPEELHPAGYCGKEAFAKHNQLVQATASLL
ncbi:hypothetical protein PDESU_06202 [Pontiella desulfatans]|uniref:Transcriptional repressor PaaX-like central Cas2-like domain-containing protein n=1 Tax=Pontiella desulfatans TaxID=2750659 RepID=A0A6C2UCM5_PONDE|nr:PaaX family transcriptional regulator C-terminal domain-containing protein [Pontiella desulfatans]VGO17603.1 hypothetical protein PDESU_06202 [Pontiella desulfatans]